jgi:polar amino acid transport system substrate-binding protein
MSMKIRTTILAVLCCLELSTGSTFAGSGCTRVIVSGDPNYSPFSWYDGKAMRGAAQEIVARALDKIGLPHETRYAGPFARMMLEAEHGAVDIVAELKDIPERQSLFAFSHTAMFLNPIAVFTRTDAKIQYDQWGDLRSLRGGITNANRFGGGFDEFMAENLTVELANDIKGNFDKLAHRHIDYFVTAYYPGMNYLVQAKRQAEFKALQPYVTESANYVGWSKASGCLSRLPELDQALSSMEASGEIAKIINHYLDEWRADTLANKSNAK